jgi:hypothetical protein
VPTDGRETGPSRSASVFPLGQLETVAAALSGSPQSAGTVTTDHRPPSCGRRRGPPRRANRESRPWLRRSRSVVWFRVSCPARTPVSPKLLCGGILAGLGRLCRPQL